MNPGNTRRTLRSARGAPLLIWLLCLMLAGALLGTLRGALDTGESSPPAATEASGIVWIAQATTTAPPAVFTPVVTTGNGDRPIVLPNANPPLPTNTRAPEPTPRPAQPAAPPAAVITATPQPPLGTNNGDLMTADELAPTMVRARLLITKLGVDAPIAIHRVGPGNVMESPSSAAEVAWYTFSAMPNTPGNIVLAGHVDYIGAGRAVFWSLDQLRPGDEITMQLRNGQRFRYQVSAIGTAPDGLTSEQATEIIGSTSSEVLTLITCTGSYDRASQSYARRLIVRAVRIA